MTARTGGRTCIRPLHDDVGRRTGASCDGPMELHEGWWHCLRCGEREMGPGAHLQAMRDVLANRKPVLRPDNRPVKRSA